VERRRFRGIQKGGPPANGNSVQLKSLTEVAGFPVTLGQGLKGFTLYQLWDTPSANVVYSLKPETEVIVLHDYALDVAASFYHELEHVVLGDFGRNPLAGQHNAPGVNAATEHAEEEARRNAASPF
jgi:hypothetical protein